jgi:hypothetical protein
VRSRQGEQDLGHFSTLFKFTENGETGRSGEITQFGGPLIPDNGFLSQVTLFEQCGLCLPRSGLGILADADLGYAVRDDLVTSVVSAPASLEQR